MSALQSLYVATRNLCVISWFGIALIHIGGTRDYWELAALVAGLWFGAWMRDLLYDLRRR